ncbi:hypothetical protein CK203_084592 [Vitis vinifera]|uniref:DUF4283 domain-containing protein n=1 Tax=Vitis vinifera TaxID=29760 RepID=A0A438DK43_VITVI|nr:hypothetical protein CK203_084592 [Vitis vinifera]
MKSKVERIFVEKKNFQVEFEGLNGGTWVSVTERSRGFVVSIGFDMEELDWLMVHLKKAVEVEASGVLKPLFLVVPEGVKGKGWEDLRKAILSVQENSERDGGASKEKNGDIRMNRDTSEEEGHMQKCQEKVQDWTHEGRAIARMMGMKGMVSINPISAFKGCFFVSSTRRAERVHDQGRLSVKGRTILLRKWSPKENMVVQGKFRRGWLGNEGGKGDFEAGGLDEAKLWVEMLPNVVYQRCLRNEWVRVGGCVSQSSKAAEGLRGSVRDIECYRKRRLPRARHRQSRSCLAVKGEIEGGWSRSGQAEAIFGPVHESPFKAHKARAQSGMRHRGLQDGPDAPQALQSASASSLSPQRVASSTEAIATLCPEDARSAPRFSLEKKVGPLRLRPSPCSTLGHRQTTPWAVSLKARRGGPKLRRIEAFWYGSLVAKRSNRSEEGESSRGSHEGCYAGGRDGNYKKTWSTLFPPSADRRQGHRCCSEPIFTRGSSSSSEGRNWDGLSDGARNQSESSLQMSSGWYSSKEDTSASRVELKGGLLGRAGLDPRGYSVMGSPSNPIIRGKGLIFEGFCEIPGAKILEVCQPSSSQTPESPFLPSCSPVSPLTNPSGPILPNSVPLSQSPTEDQGISKFFYEKGGVDYLNHGDIPDRVEEENQCALSNQMTESCTPKDSIVRSHKEVSGDFLIDGLSPGKMAKCERYYALLTLSWNVRGLGSRNKRRMVKDFLRTENPDVVMIQETKKEICDRRFVGSVWTARNKDWVALPASGASGGILIIWDSKNLRREEV